jgi:hypothetical protein
MNDNLGYSVDFAKKLKMEIESKGLCGKIARGVMNCFVLQCGCALFRGRFFGVDISG